MGTDNLFTKRKAKQTKDLKRKQAKRAVYDKVLIVCEGKKTEPNYFKGLRDCYRLNSANIDITHDRGSAPKNVLKKAEQRYREEKDKGIPFDRVYCVFDKDTHTSYQDTLQTIEQKRTKNTFFAITSVPSFEFWLLLHFEYTASPVLGITGRKSAGDQVLAKLKQYIPDYQKAEKGHFIALKDQLPFAIANARRVCQTAEKNETDNPSTQVHVLVEYLQSLATTN